MEFSKRENGFTLIELAIVLVIIGLIIGAVLKGQDLIQNARAKQFINKIRAVEAGIWTHLDRKGYFPCDTNRDGLISEDCDIEASTFANFSNPPDGNFTLGSYHYDISVTNATNSRNVIVVNSTRQNTFTEDEIVFVESFDTAIDGESNSTEGQVLASDGSSTWSSASALYYYFDSGGDN